MSDRAVLMVLCLPFLTTCSDNGKLHMILKALDESYKNHIGFGIIRGSELVELVVRNSSRRRPSMFVRPI